MDYCEYFARFGIRKPGCPEIVGMPEFKLPGQEVVVPAPAPKVEHRRMETLVSKPVRRFKTEVCQVRFSFDTCQYNENCESRQLCIQVTGETCCAPTRSQCPTPEQLGVKCVSANPVNWCHRDSHCSRGRKCCATGCGYNICV
uniref:WAP domain-containing protein n=1 Tax=Panagrellus redivivus TaxID=6233 RepID=A0A7E4ZV57_PANRE